MPPRLKCHAPPTRERGFTPRTPHGETLASAPRALMTVNEPGQAELWAAAPQRRFLLGVAHM
jgi:hypothetical protein